MSVLAFPRLYFSGYMQWNVNTTNNNDYVPAYDATNAALDWDYLATQDPPITPKTFGTTFRPWVVLPNQDACPPGSPPPANQDNCKDDPTCHMTSRWNYYGNQGAAFVQYQQRVTVTTGGVLAPGSPAAAGDAILGQPLSISGRLVDINPASPFCSQIYFGTFKAGNAATFVGGPQLHRMYSRSFFVPRNIASDLIIAGAIGTVFQTTIPTAAVTAANGGGSALLAALLAALQAQGAAGLMIRFSAYNTLYYQNGIFNGTKQQPRSCDELTRMYQDGEVFTNPAYSAVAGAIGVWNDGELATAPGGRMLVANAKVTPLAAKAAKAVLAAKAAPAPAIEVQVAGHARAMAAAPAAPAEAAPGPPPAPLALGVIMAEIDTAARIVSLDLMNAIPEWTSSGDKFDYGDVEVGVQLPDGTFEPLGTFGFADYDRTAYLANGGIVDVPLDPEVSAEQLDEWAAEGLLALRIQGDIASLEVPLTAQTDDRGAYLDECNAATITLQVLYKGAAAPAGTQVLLAQYFPWPLLVGTGQWVLFGTTPPSGGEGDFCNVPPPPSYLSFPGGNVATVGDDGTASFTVAPQAPGFPIVAYYPYLKGQPTPTPQSQVGFGFTSYQTTSICTAFFSAVRVLPFDNALVARFVDCWNGTGAYAGEPKHSESAAWQFVYTNILYLYDMLYPAMDQIIPLGDQGQVQSNITAILQRIAASAEDTSGYMPVTRELSAAKRLILEAWGSLVEQGFPPRDLPPIVVPCNLGA